MTSVIKGRWNVQGGKKLKKVDTASVSRKIGRKAKADGKEAAYRANRERSK